LEKTRVKRYIWAAPGDVNAFFGLMLDNIADLVLLVGLLKGAYDFDATFALRYMVPGTAVGVLVGDLLFTWQAFRLARRTGRSDITAMPLGLDTPSTFGLVFFVLGPAFLAAKQSGLDPEAAARHAWHIGMATIVTSGVFKLACAAGTGWIRRILPRAGLLGSLAAIALVLISFLPLLELLHVPVVGFLSLAVILTTLVARLKLPGRIPGALGALLVGGIVYYCMRAAGAIAPEASPINPADALLPTEWLEAFRFEWVQSFGESLRYLPVVIPFALATIVGGIDCTESAAAAGDEYHTPTIIAIEGFATVVAGLCGAVLQTTPYIGHPAYKAMGGRAAYTLATALFVGSAGLLGYFAYFYAVIPKAAIFPIMIFIGLEITAQSFLATPRKHYPAVVLACIPAMASLLIIFVDQLLATLGTTLEQLAGRNLLLAQNLQTIRMLSSGFIVTSLLWASALASLIDRRLKRAACYFAVAAVCAFFGIIHSPLPGSPLALPWRLPAELPAFASGQSPYYMAGSYAAVALLWLAWDAIARPKEESECS